MYSAAVNAALAEFFSIAGTEAGNIPLKSGNILGEASNTLNNLCNIPATSASNIPASNIPAGDNIPSDLGNILSRQNNIPLELGNTLPRRDNIPGSSASNIPLESSNLPLKSLVMEVLPGKKKA
jgi:hypothetical protein